MSWIVDLSAHAAATIHAAAGTIAAIHAPGTALSTTIVTDLLQIEIPWVEKVLRTILVYLAIVVILRVAGKRLMAQMNNLDLVVVLLLSNVVQNAIIGSDNSLVGGVVGAVVLIAANSLVDRWAGRSPTVRRLLEGHPSTLIRDGEIDEQALRRLGMTRSELTLALRRQGADAVAEVKEARIDPAGEVSVDLQRDEQAASRGELRAAVEELRGLILSERGHQPAPTDRLPDSRSGV